MTNQYPGARNNFSDPAAGTPQNQGVTPSQAIKQLNDAIEAHEAVIGIPLDTDPATHDYLIRHHVHAHSIMSHLDASGGVPLDGQLFAFSVDDETGTGQWFAADPPSTDHGALSGLGDDDHPQYAKAPHTHTGESIVDNRTFRSHSFASLAATQDRVMFIAPFPCRIRAVRTFRTGGTSASVNARVNGTTAVLAADLVTTDGAVVSSADVDVAVTAGQYVEARVTAIVGTANAIYVQIDIERIGP